MPALWPRDMMQTGKLPSHRSAGKDSTPWPRQRGARLQAVLGPLPGVIDGDVQHCYLGVAPRACIGGLPPIENQLVHLQQRIAAAATAAAAALLFCATPAGLALTTDVLGTVSCSRWRLR